MHGLLWKGPFPLSAAFGTIAHKEHDTKSAPEHMALARRSRAWPTERNTTDS